MINLIKAASAKVYLKLIVLGLALFGIPTLALAGGVVNPGGGLTAWDYYAFGNGQVLANILNSIAAMMSDPGYANLLWFLAVLGTFVTAAMAGFNMSKNGTRFLTYFFVTYLTIYAMVGSGGGGGLTANVLITDVASNQTYMVTNIPAVVAVPAAMISEIGQWLTKKMEQTFSMPGVSYPDSMKISGGGAFNMAASIMDDVTKLQINNASLSQSISNYMQDCVIPMIANGQIPADALVTSPDLWSAIASTNQAILTNYYSLSGTTGSLVEPCSNAYTDITADLTQYVPQLMSESAGAFGNTAVGSILASRLDDATYWLSNGVGVAGGGAGTVKQAAVLNQMTSAYSQMAATSNNNVLITSMALEQAKQSQLSSWISSADIFKRMMGYIYAVLQAFIFGIIPIVAAAVLIPGLGGGILKSFGQILLWLVLWNPLFAVVSFIMASYAQTDMSPLLAGASGSLGGLTMGTVGVVSSASNNMVAAAGFLGTMVPLIAWGLVKGQMAFTEFVTHGIGSSFASSAGAMMATGNVSLDNQSIGNQNFNKHSMGSKSDMGHQGTTTSIGAGALSTSFQDGGTQHQLNGGAVSATHSAQSSEQLAKQQQLVSGLSSELSDANSYATQTASSYTKAASTAIGSMVSYMHTHNNATALQDASSVLEKNGVSHATAVDVTSNWSNQSKAELNSELGTMLKQPGGAGKVAGILSALKGGLGTGVSANASTGSTTGSKDAVSNGTDKTHTVGGSKSTTDSNQEGDGSSKSDSATVSRDLKVAATEGETYTKAQKKVESLTNSLGLAKTQLVSDTFNYNQALTDAQVKAMATPGAPPNPPTRQSMEAAASQGGLNPAADPAAATATAAANINNLTDINKKGDALQKKVKDTTDQNRAAVDSKLAAQRKQLSADQKKNTDHDLVTNATVASANETANRNMAAVESKVNTDTKAIQHKAEDREALALGVSAISPVIQRVASWAQSAEKAVEAEAKPAVAAVEAEAEALAKPAVAAAERAAPSALAMLETAGVFIGDITELGAAASMGYAAGSFINDRFVQGTPVGDAIGKAEVTAAAWMGNKKAEAAVQAMRAIETGSNPGSSPAGSSAKPDTAKPEEPGKHAMPEEPGKQYPKDSQAS
jgi:hypothetical protein